MNTIKSAHTHSFKISPGNQFLLDLSKAEKRDEEAEKLAYHVIGKESKTFRNRYLTYSNHINEQSKADAPLAVKLTHTITKPLSGALHLTGAALCVAIGAVKGLAGVAMLAFGKRSLIRSAGKDFDNAAVSAQRGISLITEGVLYPIRLASQKLSDTYPTQQQVNEQGKQLKKEFGVPKSAWSYNGVGNYYANMGHIPLAIKLTITRDIIPHLQQDTKRIEHHIKHKYAENKKHLSNTDLQDLTEATIEKLAQIKSKVHHFINKDPNNGIYQFVELDASFKKERTENTQRKLSEKIDALENKLKAASPHKTKEVQRSHSATLTPVIPFPKRTRNAYPKAVGANTSRVLDQRKVLEQKLASFV